MADGLVGEAITAHVSQHVSSVNKENSCECCIHSSMELREVKLELSSCREIIRILQEEIRNNHASSQFSASKLNAVTVHNDFKTPTTREDWTIHSTNRRSYSRVTSSNPKHSPLITSNQFALLVNLKDDNVNPSCAPLNKRSQPIRNCYMKRRPAQLSVKQTQSVKHKVVIIGDSHTRNSAAELQHTMGPDFAVTSFVKPGAGMEQIVKAMREDINKLNGNDVVVIGGGSNDVGKNNSKVALSHQELTNDEHYSYVCPPQI